MASEVTADNSVIVDSLVELGIVLGEGHAPRTGQPLLHVIVRVGDANRHQLLATIGSLLRSSCQDFVVSATEGNWNGDPMLRDWIRHDSRFSPDSFEKSAGPASRYTMVLGAGTVLGTHSIAGLLEGLVVTGASVIRVLVDSQRTAPEIWKASELAAFQVQGDPEELARRNRAERWMSGDSLGIHDCAKPKPRQYQIKGAAGVPELRLVVRDLNDSRTREDYEAQIRSLQSKLRRAQIERRRAEGSVRYLPLLSRARSVVRRGPKYMLRKLRERTRRVIR